MGINQDSDRCMGDFSVSIRQYSLMPVCSLKGHEALFA